MDKEKGLLNDKFSFRAMSNGFLHKTKIFWVYCHCELSNQRSTSITHIWWPDWKYCKKNISWYIRYWNFLTPLHRYWHRPRKSHIGRALLAIVVKWVSSSWNCRRSAAIIQKGSFLQTCSSGNRKRLTTLPKYAVVFTKVCDESAPSEAWTSGQASSSGLITSPSRFRLFCHLKSICPAAKRSALFLWLCKNAHTHVPGLVLLGRSWRLTPMVGQNTDRRQYSAEPEINCKRSTEVL